MKKQKMKLKAFKLAHLAEKALKEAVNEVVLEHKKTGEPVVIWRNGKVMHVSAASLLKNKW